jgi:nucleoside-diphosphate-sugar epimerase
MAPRSLITGGAGFVGSHLAEELLQRGEEVYILDDLSTGCIDNIEHLKPNSRFHYLIESVHNEPLLAELVDRCDVVYHLAAAVGVKLIVESPVNTIKTNVHGTEVVLTHANKKKKKVLITSTSEVYGKSTAVPFREDQDLVLGPTTKGRWSYACSKAIDEFLAIAYWHEKHLPVVIVRLFNTVGPPADRSLWHGDSQFCSTGHQRSSHYGLWGWPSVSRIRLCGRCGESVGGPDTQSRGCRRGFQCRQHKGNYNQRTGRIDKEDDWQQVGDHPHPLRPRLRKGF